MFSKLQYAAALKVHLVFLVRHLPFEPAPLLRIDQDHEITLFWGVSDLRASTYYKITFDFLEQGFVSSLFCLQGFQLLVCFECIGL